MPVCCYGHGPWPWLVRCPWKRTARNRSSCHITAHKQYVWSSHPVHDRERWLDSATLEPMVSWVVLWLFQWPPEISRIHMCVCVDQAITKMSHLCSWLLASVTNRDVSTRTLSQYKNRLSRYGDFHYKDKTAARPSYLYNGNSYTDTYQDYVYIKWEYWSTM